MKLKVKHWGYVETHYGHYIQLLENDKVIWESTWYETHDLDDLKSLQEQVYYELTVVRKLMCDCSSVDLYEWKIT